MRSFADCITDLCNDVEQDNYLTPLFLDWWQDENDQIYLTQTGELSLNLNPPLGSYGSGTQYIKTSDWTLDALSIKNEVWFTGGTSAGFVPLQLDSGWATAHGAVANDIWTQVGYPSFVKVASSDANLLTYSLTNDAPPSGNPAPFPATNCLHLKFSKGPGISTQTQYIGFGMNMPFGPSNNSAFNIFRRGPNGHLNWYNNDVMDESMGPISAVQFWMMIPQTQLTLITQDMAIAIIAPIAPGSSTLSTVNSGTVTYNPRTPYGAFPTFQFSPWSLMTFPLSPSNSTQAYDNTNHPALFMWQDVQYLWFLMTMPSITIGTFDCVLL